MIAVDSSALTAIILAEPDALVCVNALSDADEILISPVTVVESLIVAGRRNLQTDMSVFVDSIGFTIVPVTETRARRRGLWALGQGCE